MSRPTSGYRLADNTRVPGTTTIIPCWDHNGLVYAANALGLEGKRTRDVWGKEIQAGNVVHAMVEAWANGEDADKAARHTIAMADPPVEDPDEVLGKAALGFAGFRDWSEMTRLEILWQEQPLVSEIHCYGGTPDAVGHCGGKLALLDWKTGSLYPSVVLQLAAYRQLWSEHNPTDTLESFHVVRFNKSSGGFTHTSFPAAVIERGWQCFLASLSAYRIYRQIQKDVK